VDTCATTTTKTKAVKLRAEPKSIGIRALKHLFQRFHRARLP